MAVYEKVPPQKRTALRTQNLHKKDVTMVVSFGDLNLERQKARRTRNNAEDEGMNVTYVLRASAGNDMRSGCMEDVKGLEPRTRHEHEVTVIAGACEDAVQDDGEVRWDEQCRADAEH